MPLLPLVGEADAIMMLLLDLLQWVLVSVRTDRGSDKERKASAERVKATMQTKNGTITRFRIRVLLVVFGFGILLLVLMHMLQL